MKLRYTGIIPTTFIGLGREVQPDEVFDVLDEESEGLLVRSDIEEVKEPKPAKKTAPKPPTKETPDAVPDDH